MVLSTQDSPSSFRLPADFDYERQSITLPGTKRPGQTAIYRHAAYANLVDFNTEGVIPNPVDIFQSALNRYSTQPCLGYRQLISKNPSKFASTYTWISYSEVDQRRRKVGSALEYLWEQRRAGGGELQTIGIWSQNRVEWQIIDLACHAYAKVTVALYDTLGSDSVEYICNHAELSVIFTSANHLPTLLAIASRLKYLKLIVCIDDLGPSSDAAMLSKAWASNLKIEFFTFSELEVIGMDHIKPIKPASPNQLCTICYTSGTTGNPKGVLITHGQLAISCITGLGDLRFSTPGRMLSYLPAAHIYGRGLELCMLYHGVSIGYFTGDPLRLLEDAQVLQPTFFPAVPRILNKIYQAANAAGNVPGIRGELFRRAVAAKLQNFHATGQLTHPIWDRLVFRKVQALLGGKIENMTCGSAPISSDCLNFAKIALACDIYEETTTVSTITITRDKTSTGTIGPPQPCCEVKLVDVSSMGYTSEDKPYPRGEFCSRGVVNTDGYYKDPEATAELIDNDGWLHSGDIAEVDSRGRFKIIDRIKNIMKLSQGEFVALEKIQNVYSAVPLISQIFVHGNSLCGFLIAVVVLEFETLTKLASSACDTTVNSNDFAALVRVAKDDRVKAAILKEMDEYGRSAGLKGFEMVKDLVVTVQPFSVEEGTLTPTLKIKRREAYEKYKRELDALYEATESPSKL